MSDDTPPTMLEATHTEIDAAEDDLQSLRRDLETVVNLRNLLLPNRTEAYIAGLHDGLAFSEGRVGGITRYEDHGEVYRVDGIPDDELARKMEIVVTEARMENWGNAFINLPEVVDRAEELANEKNQPLFRCPDCLRGLHGGDLDVGACDCGSLFEVDDEDGVLVFEGGDVVEPVEPIESEAEA